jgi:glycerophosphoryl diester phosphodiesterase
MGLLKKPIAHRGLWDEKNPENTLGAFVKAAEKGYPIELDVQLTSDNQVVVFHDEYLDRLTEEKGQLCKRTYEQLKTLKIANSKYKIPLLKEVLEEINCKVPLLVEIKSAESIKTLCDGVVKEFLNYKGEFALQSFNPYILKYLYDKYPVLIRGQLAAFDYGDEVSAFKAFLLRRMFFNHSTKPHFISYYAGNLPNDYVNKCKKRNIAVLAWTVKSQEEYDKLKGYVDNIIFEGFEPK